MKRTILKHYKQKIYTPFDPVSSKQLNDIALFLIHELGTYGYNLSGIKATLGDAVSKEQNKGGFIITYKHGDEFIGVVVINRNSNADRLHGNILSFIGVKEHYRENVIGPLLMKLARRYTDGILTIRKKERELLHDYYEKLGFNERHFEMRSRQTGK